jgi:nitrate/nitrite-specific signal transduction histidine kinase
MQERAELLGGTLAIFAQPGEGTRIVFKLPKTVLSHSLEEQALGHLAPA